MQEENKTNLSRAPAWRAFRAAAPQTLPVFAGYLVLGLGYGIYVQSLGLPVWLPPLMGTVAVSYTHLHKDDDGQQVLQSRRRAAEQACDVVFCAQQAGHAGKRPCQRQNEHGADHG